MNIMMTLAGVLTDVDLKNEILSKEIDLVIAVDGGYEVLKDNDIEIDLLIGDMDSIHSDYNVESIKLNPQKDYSDFAVALEYVKENYEYENIYVYGAISLSRIDHVLSNIGHVDERIIFITENQLFKVISNKYLITERSYKYFSFFAITDVGRLSLKGFKYELENYNLNVFDPLCLSNELVLDQEAEVTYEYGKLLMICSENN